MGNYQLLGMSLLLFSGSLLLSRNRSRSKPILLLSAFLVFLYSVLAALFVVADYFTGDGINDAVMYHLLYGVGGAGFGEYLGITAFGVGIIVAGLIVALIFYYKNRKFAGASAHKIRWVSSTGLLLTSFIVSPAGPAISDYYFSQGADDAADLAGSYQAFTEHYKIPSIQDTGAHHPNFVFIYAESLERTYFDEDMFPGLIKGLRELESDSTYFTEIEQVSGTGWTVAGMVASQCGIPLVTTSHGNSMSGVNEFYPGATCIGDLLHDQDYYLSFLQGSKISFSGIDKLLSTHHFDAYQGIDSLEKFLVDKSYKHTWGLYDDFLFDIAYKEFLALSKRKEFFGQFIATMDTHHPKGYLSDGCENIKYKDGRNAMLNAVACSDRLISNFVKKIQESEYGDNTVVIITSDHLAMNNVVHKELMEGKRRNLLMIVDPRNRQRREVNKPGTPLDISSTLLGVLGYEGEVGLGRNLLADEHSLISKFEDFDQEIERWTPMVKKFWGFPIISDDLAIAVNENVVQINAKDYQYPLLIKLNSQLESELYFGSSPRELFEYVAELDEDDLFVWIDSCSRTIGLLDASSSSSRDEHADCVVYGKFGGEVSTRTLDVDFRVPLEKLTGAIDQVTDKRLSYKRRIKLSENRVRNSTWESWRPTLKKAKATLRSVLPEDLWAYLKKAYRGYGNDDKRTKEQVDRDSRDVSRFIAHAGGKIDAHTYTNSLEALDLSYKKGFKLFELDIIKTSDNVYVASHDWDTWARQTGYKGELPPSHEIFKKHKIYEKYTPLDIGDINRWFERHMDAILVTDKVNEPIDFSEKFVDKNRLMMELFSIEKVLEGIKSGIRASMPTWRVVKKLEGGDAQKLLSIGVTAVARSRRAIKNDLPVINNLMEKGIKVYVFHVNHDEGKDERYVVCNDMRYVYGLYADEWDFSSEWISGVDCSG